MAEKDVLSLCNKPADKHIEDNQQRLESLTELLEFYSQRMKFRDDFLPVYNAGSDNVEDSQQDNAASKV